MKKILIAICLITTVNIAFAQRPMPIINDASERRIRMNIDANFYLVKNSISSTKIKTAGSLEDDAYITKNGIFMCKTTAALQLDAILFVGIDGEIKSKPDTKGNTTSSGGGATMKIEGKSISNNTYSFDIAKIAPSYTQTQCFILTVKTTSGVEKKFKMVNKKF